MRVVAIGLLTAGLVLGAPGPAPAGAQSAEPSGSPAPRSVVLRSIRLGADETLTVALHPSAAPIELRAAPADRLEVCPGLLNGGVPGPDGFSSWPSGAGFTDCLPFADDGSVTLPSTGVDTFHLAFLVRTRDPERTRLRRLEITYAPGDGYFEVLPPPIAPGARAPTVGIVPGSARTIGAQAYGLEYEAARTVRVRVQQEGRRVGRTSARPPGGESQAYGPVRSGKPVRVTATNRGTRVAAVRLALAWA